MINDTDWMRTRIKLLTGVEDLSVDSHFKPRGWWISDSTGSNRCSFFQLRSEVVLKRDSESEEDCVAWLAHILHSWGWKVNSNFQVGPRWLRNRALVKRDSILYVISQFKMGSNSAVELIDLETFEKIGCSVEYFTLHFQPTGTTIDEYDTLSWTQQQRILAS